MSIIHYQSDRLHMEQIAIADLAKSVNTPFYCYSQSHIEAQYKVYHDNLVSLEAQICFALKANSNQAVIKVLADLGAGADVVSEGELRRALKAGIPASKIVYSGVAKTASEIAYALQQDILQFNVESLNELEQINRVAVSLNTKARIAFRINPDVDARTHEKISTGKAENKFGISILEAPEIYHVASQMPGIIIQGVDMHIGSQLTDLEPYDTAFALLIELVQQLRAEGHPISHIDLGGGLGVNYSQDCGAPSIAEYCQRVARLLHDWDGKVILEPGRSLVAEAGWLVSQVVYIKQGQERTFCILDAAMNDLLRPSMYSAVHEIIPERHTGERQKYDIVGPVCETGDTFARNYVMSEVQEHDLIAITHAGAYGAVMSSTYNSRLLVPEVLVKGDKFQLIRQRTDYDALIELDNLAEWQSD